MDYFAEARAKADRDYLVTHVDGVSWHDAPVPRRWHRCKVQTKAFPPAFKGRRYWVFRCACGAIAIGRLGRWAERNSRRREDARRDP